MIPYIVYVALITCLCFLFYRLLLHRETFFRLNRWFFLGCLLCSFSMPLLHVPGRWSLRTKDPTRSTLVEKDNKPFTISRLRMGKLANPDPEEPPIRKINSKKSEGSYAPKLNISAPSETKSMPVNDYFKDQEGSPVFTFRVLNLLYYVYLCGALIFGVILLLQVVVLIYQVFNNPVTRVGMFRIVQTSGNRAPCSFGRYIFINPLQYDEETFQQILSHEKIHVQQGHSIDIILAELCIVVQWFNPFAWFYRKALEDNLEFLTDAAVIRDPRTNLSNYQMSLLRVSAPHLPLSITSNYNQSLLKKRIIMMHIQKSSVRTTWKYLFLLPLLTGMVCIFNDTAAVSQNANANRAGQQTVKTVDATNGSILQEQAVPSNSTGLSDPRAGFSGNLAGRSPTAGDTDIIGTVHVDHVTYANVETNVNPELIVNTVPVVDPTVNVNLNIDQPDQRKGTWMATMRGDTVELTLRSEEGDGYRGFSTNTEMIRKSEFSSLPTGQKAEFTVTREAGTLYLNGAFDGNDGFGHYTFKENKDFQNYLEKAGVTGVTDKRMFNVFFAAVTKAYVEELAHAGYGQLGVNNLIGMSAMKLDATYIQSWKVLGYPDLRPNELIALKSMNIDAAYLKELEKAGLNNLPSHDLVAAKSVGIDAAYVQSWKQAGFNDLSIHDLISVKSMDLDPAYARNWKLAGFTDLSIHDLISVRSMGLDPAYNESWKQAGFTDLSIHDLVSAKSMGINPAYAQTWKLAGYKDFSIQDLISLKSQGIDGIYVQSWKTLGYSDLSTHELVALKSVGVNAAYLKEMQAAGYSHLEAHELVSFKSVGVTPGFIKGFQSLGFKDIPVHTIMELKSIGVTPDYISSMKNKGFNSADLQEYIKLKTFR